MNSSKLNLPSKSRSIELKNSSTSSLPKHKDHNTKHSLEWVNNTNVWGRGWYEILLNSALMTRYQWVLIVLHCSRDPWGVQDLSPLLGRQLPVLVLVRLVEHPSDLPENKYWKNIMEPSQLLIILFSIWLWRRVWSVGQAPDPALRLCCLCSELWSRVSNDIEAQCLSEGAEILILNLKCSLSLLLNGLWIVVAWQAFQWDLYIVISVYWSFSNFLPLNVKLS